MPESTLLPKHESLWRAVAWLAEQGRWTVALVEEASRRYDLSPTDENFLLEQCRRISVTEQPPTT